MMLSTSVVSNVAYVAMTIAQGESLPPGGGFALSGAGGPLDLTGYSLKMEIAFTAPLILSTANGGITITDAENGMAQINITAADSAAFAPGTYAFDLFSISPAGESMRLFPGSFTVLKSITPIP